MTTALISLAISGFISATILPGTSEAGLVAFLVYYPKNWLIALILVTITNTMGSLTSFFITYFIPHKKKPSERTLHIVRRFGTPLLFFTFAPVVGDLLPLAAGWLKLSVWKVTLFILLGKLARYCVIVYVMLVPEF